ncbi:GGDEF domain-containing protein [Colwellia sp. MT41]|uniref:GGDEF domain-containing protein n=1 Tax=Colwellia sp. MT41 TaxID=58049 RepID=UPI0018DC0972|nr:diguanylate cyclase [Colwellia sp. MT41]
MLWAINFNILFMVVIFYVFEDISSPVPVILIIDVLCIFLGILMMYVFRSLTAPILFTLISTVFLLSYGMVITGGISSPFTFLIISLPIVVLTFGDSRIFVSLCISIAIFLVTIFLAQSIGWIPPEHPETLTKTGQFILLTGALSHSLFGGLVAKQQIKDVQSQLQDEREVAIKESRVDLLTGLLNRRAFVEDAGKIIAREERNNLENKKYNNKLIYLAMIDIDFFKKVNDTYGHSAGDDVLIEVAKSLKGSTREFEVLARLGGEEFVILLECNNPQRAIDAGERIRANVEGLKCTINETNVRVTISIGISSWEVGENLDVLLINADKVLYKAKDSGRNRVVMYYRD